MCAKCTVFIFVIFHTYKIIPVKLWRAQRPWHRCAEHIVSPAYANHRFWTVLPAICVGLLVRLRHKAKGINCSICICMTTHVCRPRNVCDEHGLLSLNSTSSTWHATWPLVVSSSNLNRANKNWTISQCRPICLLYLQKLTPDVMKHQSQTDKYSKKTSRRYIYHHHHHHHTNIIRVLQRTASRRLKEVKTARRERNSVVVNTGISQGGTKNNTRKCRIEHF